MHQSYYFFPETPKPKLKVSFSQKQQRMKYLSSEDQFRSQLLSFTASNRAFLNLDVSYGRNETALSVLSMRQRGAMRGLALA